MKGREGVSQFVERMGETEQESDWGGRGTENGEGVLSRAGPTPPPGKGIITFSSHRIDYSAVLFPAQPADRQLAAPFIQCSSGGLPGGRSTGSR